jgi:hypothetical protein
MKVITPIGTARYCWLTNPATGEYDGEHGLYRTELVLSQEDWEALKLEIKPEFEAFLESESQKKGKQLKQAASPFKIDDEGNYYIKTKRKAAYNMKANARDVEEGKAIKVGDPVTIDAPTTMLVDSAAQPIKGDKPIIGAGSRLRLGLQVRFWHVPSQGVGMTLEPRTAQIIELADVGESENVSGFKAEESGYKHGGETFEFKKETELNEKEEEAKPLAADF